MKLAIWGSVFANVFWNCWWVSTRNDFHCIGFSDLVTAKQGRIMGFKCFPIIGFFKDCDSVPVVGIYPKLDSLQNSL